MGRAMSLNVMEQRYIGPVPAFQEGISPRGIATRVQYRVAYQFVHLAQFGFRPGDISYPKVQVCQIVVADYHCGNGFARIEPDRKERFRTRFGRLVVGFGLIVLVGVKKGISGQNFLLPLFHFFCPLARGYRPPLVSFCGSKNRSG